MPTIMELLPFLRGVEEKFWLRLNETLRPGEYIQWEATHKGWILAIVVAANNRYAWIEHNRYESPMRYTYYHLNQLGVIGTSDVTVWLSRYDTTANFYCAFLTQRPLMVFKPGFYCRITAPDKDPITGSPITSPTVVYEFAVEYIDVINEDEFRESLRELIGVKKVEERRIEWLR